MKHLKIRLILILTGLLSVVTFIAQASVDDITVIALGALEGRAVVKTTDGKMKILKVGDEVPGSTATVKQILNDHLVVAEIVKQKNRKVEQMVWIYKPKKPGGKSLVKRLRLEPPKDKNSTLRTNIKTQQIEIKKKK